MKITEEGNKEYQRFTEKERFKYTIKTAKDSGFPIRTAKEFIRQYEKIFEHKCFKQSTLAGKNGKFKTFGITKDKHGCYTYKSNKARNMALAIKYMINDNRRGISDIFRIETGLVSTDTITSQNNENEEVDCLYFFKIDTFSGYEQMFCEIIYEKFSDNGEHKYFMIMPIYESVIVVCKKESEIKEIHTFISNRISE